MLMIIKTDNALKNSVGKKTTQRERKMQNTENGYFEEWGPGRGGYSSFAAKSNLVLVTKKSLVVIFLVKKFLLIQFVSSPFPEISIS